MGLFLIKTGFKICVEISPKKDPKTKNWLLSPTGKHNKTCAQLDCDGLTNIYYARGGPGLASINQSNTNC